MPFHRDFGIGKQRSSAIAVASAALLLLSPFSIGCGRPEVTTVPVTGKITLGGGTWPRPGMLYFVPKDAARDTAVRPATATFSADGTFSASSFAQGDGLVPGKYSVRVECWIVPPSMDESAPPAKSVVPLKYQTGAPGTFEILVSATDGTPLELTLDVPKE